VVRLVGMTLTVHALTSRYLTWCEKHRAPRSVEWYKGHLKGFLKHPSIAELEATAIKPFHVSEWVDAQTGWGPTYSRGAIVAVQRVWNWAIEQGHLDSSPLLRMKKPTSKRREIYMKPDDFEQILGLLKDTDPFKDFFRFCWFSGCRPQEARAIERRHVELENERIVFPAEESKGKRSKRVIYLQGVTLEIIHRLMAENKASHLFLNKRGTAWSKFAVCNRMMRLSRIVGKRLFMYAARHGFGTRKLIQGHDCLTVAALMGHTDGSMLAKVYSHIADDRAHLNKALAD
jgi:integrase/recombinase XerC